jgi:transcriptional antiterminator Rof (Rho-off)
MSWLRIFRIDNEEERGQERKIKGMLNAALKANLFHLILFVEVAEGRGFYAVYKHKSSDENGRYIMVEKVKGIKKLYFKNIHSLRCVDPIEIIKKKYGANLGKSQPRSFCNEVYCN